MRLTFLLAALAATSISNADVMRVTDFDYYGPYPVTAPLMIDSVDVNSKAFARSSFLNQPLESRAMTPSGKRHSGEKAPGHSSDALHMLAFTVENSEFATTSLNVEGLKDYVVTVDGKKASSKLNLNPSSHRVVIKYLSTPESDDSVKVSFSDADKLRIREDGKRMFTIEDVLHGPRVGSASVSPDGKYMISRISNTSRGGKSSSMYRVVETATGRIIATSADRIEWMPTSALYYRTRPSVEGKDIIACDPVTGKETLIASNIPAGRFEFTPDEKSLIFVKRHEGPKEDSQVYQILEPEDRQPGWRDRSSISVYDLASGTMRQLTHGFRNVNLLDVADDSSHILLSVSQSRYEKRPTTLFSILSLDINSMKADTVVKADGFIGMARYCSPDGSAVVVQGTPEALGAIGKNVPEGRIPSMTDNQLFLWTANGGHKALTRDFNPSVESFEWNRADGKIYLTAENRDCISFYRINPADGKIEQIPEPEDIVKGFSLPKKGTSAVWYGQSVTNPDRIYTLDTKKLRSVVLDEPQKDMLADVKLGSCDAWDFVNSRGDSICGRFYLPPNFDSQKKYPLIVNYYGGCSPTSRNFESRYPHHAYAAQGYVVYVIEPSGATGFGQEFSSRHVNTAGEGVAQDIIEGTKEFCRQHPYVDETKIGCIGASYGGFMTQYLQTVTPMFAAAISHAGISDHTSYWGEGYWGYSYSEVSMAESYPWSHPDLYVKQSPLFNADKIHTPLLFLHGDADKNVPVGESIQMFTALKLLGRETAFVAVADQDHHILDYEKRIKWQNTIFAWFAKHLKGDSTWWDHMYPKKSL